MVVNANSRLHCDSLANCLLPCSSWQTSARYHPYLSSSHSPCCRMELSRIAGVERHPSLWERLAARQSVAASDCLYLRGAASPLQAGEGMVSEPCPVRARPCPCLILARARLPFRVAAMGASACIAYCLSSRQTAPAMPAASSDAALSSAESAHAYASAFTDLHIAATARVDRLSMNACGVTFARLFVIPSESLVNLAAYSLRGRSHAACAQPCLRV